MRNERVVHECWYRELELLCNRLTESSMKNFGKDLLCQIALLTLSPLMALCPDDLALFVGKSSTPGEVAPGETKNLTLVPSNVHLTR